MAILDWIKEIPLSAIYKERLVESEKQILALERQIATLQQEDSDLAARLEQSEQNRRALEEQIKNELVKRHNRNPDGYVCDHCASSNLRRTGSRPDPTFGRLGIKRKVFMCDDCGKESSFMPSVEERKRI